MPEKGTYSFYQQLQPKTRTADEIAAGHVERMAQKRALDIQEGKYKAAQEARNKDKEIKYEGDDWTNVHRDWSGVANKIKTDYAKYAVMINDSGMARHEKAAAIEKLNSNPDSLIKLFNDYAAFGEQFSNPEYMDKLSTKERDEIKAQFKPFLDGQFTVDIDENNGFDLIIRDKDGNDFSIMDKQRDLEEIQSRFGNALADFGKMQKVRTDAGFANDSHIIEPTTGRAKPLSPSVRQAYKTAFDNNFGEGYFSEDELNSKIEAMYNQDAQAARRLPEVSDGDGVGKPEKAKFEYRPEEIDISVSDGKALTIPKAYGGGQTTAILTMPSQVLDKDGKSIPLIGRPTEIEVDANGKITHFVMNAVDPLKAQQFMDDPLAASQSSSLDVALLTMASEMTFTEEQLNNPKVQLRLKGEMTRLYQTLHEAAKASMVDKYAPKQ